MPKLSTKEQGELLAAISSSVVAVYADHFGRGPTKARSFMTEGVVTCLLEDTMTKAERRLVDSGRARAVLEVRSTFQETMREELSAQIEELTGRPVRAIVSGTQLDPDVTSQVFVLDGQRARGK